MAVEAGGERGEDAATAGREGRPDEEHHTEVTMATKCLVVLWVGKLAWVTLVMVDVLIFNIIPVSKTHILAQLLDFRCFVRN